MPFRPPQNPLLKRGSKTPPPDETFEEASYLRWLGEKQKQVSIKLLDGEIVRGWVEYYDRDMIRLTREGAPNLFIFKHEIMYIAEGVVKEVVRSKRNGRARAATVSADLPEANAEPTAEPAEVVEAADTATTEPERES